MPALALPQLQETARSYRHLATQLPSIFADCAAHAERVQRWVSAPDESSALEAMWELLALPAAPSPDGGAPPSAE